MNFGHYRYKPTPSSGIFPDTPLWTQVDEELPRGITSAFASPRENKIEEKNKYYFHRI